MRFPSCSNQLKNNRATTPENKRDISRETSGHYIWNTNATMLVNSSIPLAQDPDCLVSGAIRRTVCQNLPV